MHVRVTILVVIGLVVSLTGTGLSEESQNDAGSGGDAPGTMDAALQLSSLGSFDGAHSPLDTRDWYMSDAVDSTAPTCVRASISTPYPIATRLSTVAGDSVREVTKQGSGGRVGIATPGYAGSLVSVSATQTPITIQPYKFALEVVELPISLSNVDDGASGRDASAASPLPVKACNVAALRANQGDTEDTYAFAGQAGRMVTLSLVTHADKADKVNLTFNAPDGSALAMIVSGAFESITLPSNGTYTMTASTSSGGLIPYLIGVCEPDCTPPANPCRPSCMEMVTD